MIDEDEIGEAFGELKDLPDRAAAVLGFALVDAALRRFAQDLVAEPSDDLFGGHGILGTSSGNSEALFQFGFLPTVFYRDFALMRRTRNDFAHGSAPGLSFNSEPIAQRLGNLQFVSAYVGYMETQGADHSSSVSHFKESVRVAFLITCVIMVIFLGSHSTTRVVPDSIQQWFSR